jgi:hypothetical protein
VGSLRDGTCVPGRGALGAKRRAGGALPSAPSTRERGDVRGVLGMLDREGVDGRVCA